MRYFELPEKENQVEDIILAGDRISFLSKDHDASRDTQIASQPEKISHEAKGKRMILSVDHYERSTKKTFICALHDECRVNQESAFRHN